MFRDLIPRLADRFHMVAPETRPTARGLATVGTGAELTIFGENALIDRHFLSTRPFSQDAAIYVRRRIGFVQRPLRNGFKRRRECALIEIVEAKGDCRSDPTRDLIVKTNRWYLFGQIKGECGE
jgi:hypothetical protein